MGFLGEFCVEVKMYETKSFQEMFPFVRKFKIRQKSFADLFDPSSFPTNFFAEHFHNLYLIEIQI